MHTINLEQYKKSYKFPSNLNELKRKNLLKVFAYDIYKDNYQAKFKILQLFFPNKFLRSLEEWQLYEISKLASKLQATNLQKDTLSSFKLNKNIYKGPGDKFLKLTLNEYICAYTLMFYYQLNPKKNQKMLYDFVYCLYRKVEGGKREPFHANILITDSCKKEYANLPTHILQIISHYFLSNQDELVFKQYGSSLFPQKKGKAKKTNPKPIGWNRIIIGFVKEFGQTKEYYENMLLSEFLEMWKLLIESK